LAKDQNGADIPNKPKFIENLGLPELYFPLTGGVVTGEVKTEKRLIVENSNGFSGIELIGLASTVVIETDAAGSGYIVIRDKSGKNIGSVTLSTLIDVNSFIYPGKIEWCSLPLSEMRPHCYHANGDKYPLTSDVGKALRSLSQGYKAAHGIVESDGMINVPNVYHSDGRGYFFRANALGLKQEDISRRIYGAIGIEKGIELPTSYGAFTQNFVDIDSASHTGVSRSSKGTWNFDSSNVTPTGNENRPISYGLIPIVYLGV
ncbi:hypothetical protein, partial [Morganella morganii]|uniref:hypothetical protein n=1 Tax=Morganella morganii TaxID=582 RepID=UPI001BDA4FF3